MRSRRRPTAGAYSLSHTTQQPLGRPRRVTADRSSESVCPISFLVRCEWLAAAERSLLPPLLRREPGVGGGFHLRAAAPLARGHAFRSLADERTSRTGDHSTTHSYRILQPIERRKRFLANSSKSCA
jgi:hypothetical protein